MATDQMRSVLLLRLELLRTIVTIDGDGEPSFRHLGRMQGLIWYHNGSVVHVRRFHLDVVQGFVVGWTDRFGRLG